MNLLAVISEEKRAMIVDLNRYCLENYDTMSYAIETFDDLDWVVIVGKAKGSFTRAIAILKEEVKAIADYDAEIASTAF